MGYIGETAKLGNDDAFHIRDALSVYDGQGFGDRKRIERLLEIFSKDRFGFGNISIEASDFPDEWLDEDMGETA